MDNEQVVRKIAKTYNLTYEQAKIVIADGNCVVEACPGSGKTRTVGTRFAHRIGQWIDRRRGIAVISFTNVAAKEISERLAELGLSKTVQSPHFLGTIDSFIDRHIFIPHGHRVMQPSGPSKKPELVLEYNQSWVNDTFTWNKLKQRRFLICDFHFLADGSVRYASSNPNYSPNEAEFELARNNKLALAKAGYATHSDAMYWAMKVLESNPAIVDAIATRYPEIIIDEFQDTSEIQLRIFRLLHSTGKSKLLLIGDPHQSIFGFNQARPDVLLAPQKTFSGTWQPFYLNANFRNSQLICNTVHHFCSRALCDSAMGKHRSFSVSPLLFCYPDKKITQVVDEFEKILISYQIPLTAGVVVAYANKTITKLVGKTRTSEFPGSVPVVARKLMHAAYYRDNKRWADACQQIEYALLKQIFQKVSYGPYREALGQLSYREWRRGCSYLLHLLPKTDLALNQWLTEARTQFQDFMEKYNWDCKKDFSINKLFPNLRSGKTIAFQVSQFIGVPPEHANFDIKTIHKVKGESHTAIMLVAAPQLRSNYPSDAHDWLQPQGQNRLFPEEVRRVFVALTRPQKIVVVAVPQSAWENVSPVFIKYGFEIWPKTTDNVSARDIQTPRHLKPPRTAATTPR